MKTLVLGADGMLGSALVRRFGFLGTTRRPSSEDQSVLPEVDVSDRSGLRRAFDWAEPDVVINCVGIVKSECDKHEPRRVALVNGIAPHMIAEIAAESECRVVHVSSDCVFNGERGSRTETDTPDAVDLYGKSKAEGELVGYGHCLTLRTSFIGRDHAHRRGLVEWLLAQSDYAVGFTRAIWSGLSTLELARIIRAILDSKLRGLYNVSGPIVSKAELLGMLIEAYKLRCRVQPVDEPRLDRSLDDSKFRAATGYTPPTWRAMAKELAGA